MEVFLKRAEKSFKEKLGEPKAVSILDLVKKTTNEIPAKFRRVIGSEIPRFLFNYSQEIEDISPGMTEAVLNHVIIFTNSLKDLINKDRNQVNQLLINRSNNKMRNLSDLLSSVVEKAKNGETIVNQGKFDDILTYVFGDEAKVIQLNDIELFIKRAEKNFIPIIGQERAHQYSEEIIKSLSKTDENIRDYLESEIPKYLFKFSQNIEGWSLELTEEMLKQVIVFNEANSNLNGKTKEQVNQEIIRRSKNTVHTLLDLFITYLNTVKQGNSIESCDSFEDILTHLFGEEEKRVQFTDVEAFLKRAEKKYSLIVGQDMIQMLMEELLEAIDQIPEQHREYLGSDLAKFLFKFSETASYHEPEKIELVFNGAIMFANSLTELNDLNNAEINQFIINRSNHRVRSLFELFKTFYEKIQIRMPLSLDPSFDEILIHALGRYEGPKVIEQGGLIHDLLADFHDEIPLSMEHSRWAKAIAEIIPRFLEILPDPEGERVLDLLWQNRFPEDQILEQYRENLRETPREKENTFMFRLLNMLVNQILVEEEKDKKLTAALAFRVLGTIFIEMYGGRNTQIRGIRLNQLLKDRKIANAEKKKNMDEHINRILEEDLKAIQQRTMTISTIIPVLSKKGYFIKTYDISTKDFPELIVKLISYREEERLKDIGTEYKKSGFTGELIPLVNSFLHQFDLANRFYNKYFEEMYQIEFDAQQNMLAIRKFFKTLVEISENVDTLEFFGNKVANTEHAIYILLLKYLYNPLPRVFEITRTILDEQEYQKKIMKLDKYLSRQKLEQLQLDIRDTENKIKEYENYTDFDTSQKIMNLTKFLNRDKNEIKYYEIMFKLLDESKALHNVIKSRLDFSKSFLTYSNSLKKIHSSLPAALSEKLQNLSEFSEEIDKVVSKLKEKSSSGILSPFEFREKNDVAEMSKKELTNLCSNEDFTRHVKELQEMSNFTIY